MCTQDEDRLRRAENVVPPLEELNRMLARGPDEFELFQKMDRELQVGWGGVGALPFFV